MGAQVKMEGGADINIPDECIIPALFPADWSTFPAGGSTFPAGRNSFPDARSTFTDLARNSPANPPFFHPSFHNAEAEPPGKRRAKQSRRRRLGAACWEINTLPLPAVYEQPPKNAPM